VVRHRRYHVGAVFAVMQQQHRFSATCLVKHLQ
jgi:hypothetical protein